MFLIGNRFLSFRDKLRENANLQRMQIRDETHQISTRKKRIVQK